MNIGQELGTSKNLLDDNFKSLDPNNEDFNIFYSCQLNTNSGWIIPQTNSLTKQYKYSMEIQEEEIIESQRDKKNKNSSCSQIELHQSLLANYDYDEDYEQQKKYRKQLRHNIKYHQQNRLGKKKRSNRQQEQDGPQWSWDTSASLIRLMIRRNSTRRITNIYIWIQHFLRLYYLSLMIYYLYQDYNNLKTMIFYWSTLSVWVSIRLVFCLVVAKIVFQGNDINDKKIRIVYQTYMHILDQHCKQLEKSSNLNQAAIKFRLIMMIITPPELSFVFVSTQNPLQSGYYQVQNFIMKSLEIFFFFPFIFYFTYNKNKFFILFTDFKLQYYYISTYVLIADVSLFFILNLYLLYNNSKRSNWLKQKKTFIL